MQVRLIEETYNIDIETENIEEEYQEVFTENIGEDLEELRSTLKFVADKGCWSWSCSSAPTELDYAWLITEGHTNMYTGEITRYSLFIDPLTEHVIQLVNEVLEP